MGYLFILSIGCSEYDLKTNQESIDTPDSPSFEPSETIVTEDSAASPEDSSVPPIDEPPICDDMFFPGGDVAQNISCYQEPTIGSWNPKIKWENREVGATFTTPVVGNLTDDNGDGFIDERDIPDVVVGTKLGIHYALSGSDGSIIWESMTPVSTSPMTPALGDVDHDGYPEVIIGGPGGIASLNGQNGVQKWKVQPYTGLQSLCGGIGLYDLEGDGSVEVVIGRNIYNAQNGMLKASGVYGHGAGNALAFPISTAADINLDGKQELVVGNAAYDEQGNAQWYNGLSDGFVAIGQFDGDPEGEIVISFNGMLRLQDNDGSIIWNLDLQSERSGPPSVSDINNDGSAEIIIVTTNNISAIDTQGTLLWEHPIQDYTSGATSASIFDFEGDGIKEVVYADEVFLWVFDGVTGEVKLQEDNHSSETCTEYPIVTDVDNDGSAEIVYASAAYDSKQISGVRVIEDTNDSWAKTRSVWNQHSYSITNVHNDLSIPSVVEPNWIQHNSFRAADTNISLSTGLPDLYTAIDHVCETECEQGKIIVWGHLGNIGYEKVTIDIELELYVVTEQGEQLVDTQVVAGPFFAGLKTESITFTFARTEQTIIGLRLKVDGGNLVRGSVFECDEDNNEFLWETPVCQ